MSDTNGPAPIVSNGRVSNGRVGGPSSDRMRDPCTSGSASGKPGVKYGLLGARQARAFDRPDRASSCGSIVRRAGCTSPRRNSQRAGRHLRHASPDRARCRTGRRRTAASPRALRLERVPDMTASQSWKRRIRREDRDALAGPLVRERMIDLAHGVRLPRERRARQLHDRRVAAGHSPSACSDAARARMLPVGVTVDDVELRRGQQHRIAAARRARDPRWRRSATAHRACPRGSRACRGRSAAPARCRTTPRHRTAPRARPTPRRGSGEARARREACRSASRRRSMRAGVSVSPSHSL